MSAVQIVQMLHQIANYKTPNIQIFLIHPKPITIAQATSNHFLPEGEGLLKFVSHSYLLSLSLSSTPQPQPTLELDSGQEMAMHALE